MIIERDDGCFDIVVKNKNADETFFDYETEDEARESFVHFHKFFNGEDIDPESIAVYERNPMINDEYRRVR